MKFQLFQGGLSNIDLTDKDKENKIKNLRLHFTTIEANMASINQQAKVLGWKELDIKVLKGKDYINDILKYIKQTERKLGYNKKDKEKKENPFHIVTNNIKKEE